MLSFRFPSIPFRRVAILMLLSFTFSASAFGQETEPNQEESNPVELLPSAPDAKSENATSAQPASAAQNDSNAPRESPAPAKPAATESENSAAHTGSTPTTPNAQTNNLQSAIQNPKSNAPGALAPDDGWEILDAPRQIPTPPADDAPPPSPISGESLRAIVTRLNLALPLADGRIVIDKSERRLDLYNGSTLVKSYGVSLGKNPFGHKMREGDNRTPEGDFYICTRNAKNSAFHIFLGLSYPALPDAKRAANSKQITWREYQIIHQRLASRGRPPWETNLGGWVGIHGGTEGAFAQKKMRERGTRDWTAGCIALTNREIEELHAATRLGTPVRVQP